MKRYLVLLSLVAFSAFADGVLLEDKATKQLVNEAIVEDTYFEDEGYARIIDEKLFKHMIVKETESSMTIHSVGTGYSAWDNKEITITCDVEINSYECAPEVTKIKCAIENENWPND